MTQTALNGRLEVPKDTWLLLSEVNCTFVVESGSVEIVAMQGEEPAVTATGMTYKEGEGEPSSTDILSLYPGAGTADRIYVTSRGYNARLFVSRAAVA